MLSAVAEPAFSRSLIAKIPQITENTIPGCQKGSPHALVSRLQKSYRFRKVEPSQRPSAESVIRPNSNFPQLPGFCTILPGTELAVDRITILTPSEIRRSIPRMALLGVNIDHVATIRQARRAAEPDPVQAAVLAELGGADAITIHLREDRRHIQDRDVRVLRETVRLRLNLEMAVSDEITRIALQTMPDQVTLVPERREEVTTEGGLDVITHAQRVQQCADQLSGAGILVSLFIDPDVEQVRKACELKVAAVELHTGAYAEARTRQQREAELDRLREAGHYAVSQGLILNLGHGLTYDNVIPVARLHKAHELNIGHSIISRAVLVGLERAVREMKQLVAGTFPH